MNSLINDEYAKLTKSEKPKILLCTPEVTELPAGMGNLSNLIKFKGGGLGDISAALINYLHKTDKYELHIAIPKYDREIRRLERLEDRELDKLTMVMSAKNIHLVNKSAFSKLGLYDEDEAHKRSRRAEAYQEHVINHLLPTINPDVVHCNDWMTGLIPAAAKEMGIKSLFTLHNIFTEKEVMKNLHRSMIDVDRFKDYCWFENHPENGKNLWRENPVDFTATGIFASDFFNTVSPTYLEEVVAGYFEDIIPLAVRETIKQKYYAGRAKGILNAPDDSFTPELLRNIINYDIQNFAEGKKQNKTAFQTAMGLDVNNERPLFFWPSRLSHQKLPQILFDIAQKFTYEHNAQIAIVASGDSDAQDVWGKLACASNGSIAYKLFNPKLSELGKAASDYVLMPSLYEPCGLPQMECPRLGTLPVVRTTGGLKDTVQDLDYAGNKGNGFLFNDPDSNGLWYAMYRAVDFYHQSAKLKENNIQRIMKESPETFNLEKTAEQYCEIYDLLLEER
ncbi:glycosyltransferase [Candidatus Woesearchaeota archaeon]|nr:glycosyltransferase [Candidatus Woesearchaeota archaeon]